MTVAMLPALAALTEIPGVSVALSLDGGGDPMASWDLGGGDYIEATQPLRSRSVDVALRNYDRTGGLAAELEVGSTANVITARGLVMRALRTWEQSLPDEPPSGVWHSTGAAAEDGHWERDCFDDCPVLALTVEPPC